MFQVLNANPRLGIPKPQISGQASTDEGKPSMNESYWYTDGRSAWGDSDGTLLCTALQRVHIESVVPVADDDFPKPRNIATFAWPHFSIRFAGMVDRFILTRSGQRCVVSPSMIATGDQFPKRYSTELWSFAVIQQFVSTSLHYSMVSI